MDRHVLIVSVGTRVIAIVVGLASLTSLVGVVSDAIFFAHARSIPRSENLDIGKYGIVGLMQNGANSLGPLAQFMAAAGVWAMVALAILLLVAIVCAAIMYATGLGIAHHATWARIVAILGAFGVLALFGPLLLWAFGTQHFALALVVAPLVVASAYVAWALIWRFGSPPQHASV
jgi:hypothetical protein